MKPVLRLPHPGSPLACCTTMLAAALVGCADIKLPVDLNDGTLYHNRPGPFQADVAQITSPNGEIEDMYLSDTVTFEPRRLLVSVEDQDNLTLRLDFKDAQTGEKQYLLVAAKNTGVPFPDTFAYRLSGAPTLHPGPNDEGTLGPGMSLKSDGVTAKGELAVFLFAGPGKPKTVGYTVPIECGGFANFCQTDAHFPFFRDPDDRVERPGDLVDGDDCFLFSGFQVNFQPKEIERCPPARPDCQSLSVSSISFAMLAGDLAILSGGVELERLCPSR